MFGQGLGRAALVAALFHAFGAGVPFPGFLSSASAEALLSPLGKSAARAPGVSYRYYLDAAHIERFRSAEPSQGGERASAVESAVEFDKAQLAHAVAWNNLNEMLARFQKVRDIRFLHEKMQRPDFARRLSWLYPDDGCFARAALAISNLHAWSVPVPDKVFVFGDLSVATSNSPDGVVTWWYHVAPIVEVNQEKFILDPAIEPARPLRLVEWLGKMSKTPQSLQVALCGPGAYTPQDPCRKPAYDPDGQSAQAVIDQLPYLELEWDRIVEMKRDPEQELGAYPPWSRISKKRH